LKPKNKNKGNKYVESLKTNTLLLGWIFQTILEEIILLGMAPVEATVRTEKNVHIQISGLFKDSVLQSF
jgi:hypothetical protein